MNHVKGFLSRDRFYFICTWIALNAGVGFAKCSVTIMQIPSRARVVDITARGVGLDIRGRKGLVCFSPLSWRNFQGSKTRTVQDL